MPAKVVTVLNQKGGCGKTSTTMQLAGTFAMRGQKVLVIDTDEQGTATRWAASAPDDRPFPATVIGLAHAGAKLHREIRRFHEDYELIFVDCPPSAHSAAASSALLVADLALVPFLPAPADAWAVVAAKRLIEVAQANNESLLARIVPNLVKRTSLAADVLAHVAEDDQIPLTRTTLGDRESFRSCQLLGATVHAISRDKKAIAEVEALADEVQGLLL